MVICSPSLFPRYSPTFKNAFVWFTFSGLPTLNLWFYEFGTDCSCCGIGFTLYTWWLTASTAGRSLPNSILWLTSLPNYFLFLNIFKLWYVENQMYPLESSPNLTCFYQFWQAVKRENNGLSKQIVLERREFFSSKTLVYGFLWRRVSLCLHRSLLQFLWNILPGDVETYAQKILLALMVWPLLTGLRIRTKGTFQGYNCNF